MLVKPVPETGFIDPFMARKTLVMIGNINDPITGQDYTRDPRKHRAQGGGVPALHRSRRHRLFRSGGGVFHLR